LEAAMDDFMRTERMIFRCLIGYAVIAVLTYGLSYNIDYEQPKNNIDMNGPRAMMCSMFWPFYLSQKAFIWARD
jgi:hypothetical protein